MYISPISSANFSSLNRVTLNNPKSVETQDNTGSYGLPGYNVSFGALIKQYDKNPAVMLDREERKELNDRIDKVIAYEDSKGNEVEELMFKLFEDYSDNKAAMQHILVRGINKMKTGSDTKKISYEPHADFIKTYLNTVNSYFADNSRKRREYLNMALFTKNKDGNTLAHASIKPFGPGGNGILGAVFAATKNDPDIQLKVLKDEDEKLNRTIGERLGNGFNRSKDATAFNDAVYRLCAKTKSVSRKASIELLQANERALNDENREVLEALQSRECVCADDIKRKTSTADCKERAHSDIIDLSKAMQNSGKASSADVSGQDEGQPGKEACDPSLKWEDFVSMEG